MNLKRLRLQGYKTFATKTEFAFDQGITAIVGPNGSGKSNIADALRWVLGEQSYSALRGKRTADMIFSGSQSRSRAGMAQAILTLDNSDGWLPIDYAEVEVGRRAYRSGENEYLLNGQKVRLRDVQELLATSGLAERTYTFVSQGLVDQALSLRADERRALFEEAAGISHYKARRAETLRRLDETKRNLERVYDILSEVRPRLRSLRQQASRARNHEQVSADLRHLLRIWYGYKWDQSKRALREQRQAAEEAEAAWQESRRQMLARQQQIEEVRRAINRLQRQINEKQAERERLRERREHARRQVAVLKERQAQLERQLADIETEIPALQKQQEAAQQELSQALAGLETAQSNLAEAEEALSHFNRSFEEQQAEIDRWRKQVADLEKAHRAEQNKLSQAEGQLSQLRERLQENGPGREAHDDPDAAAAKVAELSGVVQTAQERVNDLQRQRRQLQQQRQERIGQLQELRATHIEMEKRIAGYNKEIARLEARCDLLNQMRHKEVSPGEDTPLLGRVAALVTIPDAYQGALEAALGARLATLVLPNEAALWRLLRDNNAERTVTAAVLDGVQVPAGAPLPDHPAVIGRAMDLVQHNGQAEAVIRLLFGAVILVRERRAAYEIARDLPAGTMAVTPDGFVVHAGGLVEIRPANPQHSILAREAAWRAAGEELAAKKEQLAEAQATAQAQQAKIDRVQDDLDGLQREEKQLSRSEQEAGQRLRDAERNLDRAQQQRDFVVRQQTAAVAARERLTGRIAKTEAAIIAHRAESARLDSALAEARDHLAGLPVAQAKQERQTLQQKIETARTIVSGREAVVESRRATLHQVQGQLRRRHERQDEIRHQQQNLNLSQAQSELAALEGEIGGLDEALTPLKTGVDKKQDQLEQLEDQLAERQRHTHNQETHYTQANVALSQRENQIEGLMERIKSDLGLVSLNYDDDQVGQSPLPMSEVVERLPDVEKLPEDIEEQIQRYRGQLHRMGAINPDAPAEYEAVQERHDFLEQQIEDLTETDARLRKVIAELDDLTSRAFSATVDEVNDVFGEMFQRLFGGGSAHLALTDPDDLTVSGVDIVAQLPSRRQQGLGLLSGGERSLTAAALIFALLNVSPPPFCVMDEVDAMLDEANVTRFRSVLNELSEQTQFIVITHNRGTVQAANTVYGISMSADSTSQVISIKPEEYINGK